MKGLEAIPQSQKLLEGRGVPEDEGNFRSKSPFQPIDRPNDQFRADLMSKVKFI